MLPHDRRIRKLLAVAMLAAGSALQFGCSGATPYIREGDANSVEIGYAQNVEETARLARGYCLRYERKPVFANADGDIAVYNCVATTPAQPASR
jgi:hypothetical protein